MPSIADSSFVRVIFASSVLPFLKEALNKINPKPARKRQQNNEDQPRRPRVRASKLRRFRARKDVLLVRDDEPVAEAVHEAKKERPQLLVAAAHAVGPAGEQRGEAPVAPRQDEGGHLQLGRDVPDDENGVAQRE